MMHPFYEDKQVGFRCFSGKDMTFPAHLHSAVELVFVQEGTLEVTVQEQTQTLAPREAALIFPDMVHSYRTPGFSRTCLCIFTPGCVQDYYSLFRTRQPKSPFFLCGAQNPDIPPAFDRMLALSQSAPRLSLAWLHLILAYLFDEAELIPRDSSGSTDVSHQLISYISAHFQEPLSLDRIARDLHFNKYYISRVFTGKLHCGFSEYVSRLRLEYAAQQLLSTDKSVTEIWQDAGFESQKTFNRTFLACYGVTPTNYRSRA